MQVGQHAGRAEDGGVHGRRGRAAADERERAAAVARQQQDRERNGDRLDDDRDDERDTGERRLAIGEEDRHQQRVQKQALPLRMHARDDDRDRDQRVQKAGAAVARRVEEQQRDERVGDERRELPREEDRQRAVVGHDAGDPEHELDARQVRRVDAQAVEHPHEVAQAVDRVDGSERDVRDDDARQERGGQHGETAHRAGV
jgi:hypothetical protein